MKLTSILAGAALAASTFAASADETDEAECHQWGMVAAQIAEHRDAGMPITTLLGAFPSNSGMPDLIAFIYEENPTAANAYSSMKKECELEEALKGNLHQS